ncbi:hypothetical protein RJT34_00643 [Clitoria ternatea]|uniref:Polygalacturonase n=1 Tax=Clitoria ternatea TaxID=43366 RepID=A0AAN9KG90_CLITE
MKELFVVVVVLVFVIVSPSLCGRAIRLDATPSFNVFDYGANGDGETDDTQAFVKAWEGVCGSTQASATFVIPKGKTFLLQPLSLKGPCRPATVTIQLGGIITAPKSMNDWKWPSGDRHAWIQFWSISGLVINGGGQVDGQGAAWWNFADYNHRPTSIQFLGCKNLRLSTLTLINSPRNHISIDTCTGSDISNLHIIAPKDSPNTDGIDIAGSSNILVHDSNIQTGDDCIAINTGSSFINITGVFCGPGHGISVGSLGGSGAYATAEEIHVRNCTFTRTQNGARIKTWAGGSGYARKITFEDIVLVGAGNPVVINQDYSGEDENEVEGTGVRISDVSYRMWSN